MNRDGFKGGAKNAVDHLTTFTIDSESDVMQMQRELQETQDKLKDLDRKIKHQESRVRELDQERSVADRRLNTLSNTVNDL